MARPKVFISHISTEGVLAQLLKARLTEHFQGALDVFVSSDGVSIEAGRPWLDELSSALQDAGLLLVLCSPASVGRPWVNFETGAGFIRDLRVVPACHTGLSRADLPAPMSILQGIELGSPEGVRAVYLAVAKLCGASMPATDFHDLAEEVRAFEREYRKLLEKIERIPEPRILCAASEQYAEFGFERDVEALGAAFPDRVTVAQDVTSERLRELLTSERFDIVHLVLNVQWRTGDLVFSEVDPKTQDPVGAAVDRLPAAGFAKLLAECKAKLVFLATCHSIHLAVELAPAFNAVGTHAVIDGEEASKWEGCFYGLLARGRTLFDAYEIARSTLDVPLRLVRSRDVAFAAEPS